MAPTDCDAPLPDLRAADSPASLARLRLGALEALVAYLKDHLATGVASPSALEDYSLRQLAKATGTTRSAVLLMRDQCWTDACILARAVFEQLFAYLWVVQDPDRAGVRTRMVSLKQEWANAKYLEGLASQAGPEARSPLLEEAAAYKRVADAMLRELAAELGTTEKKVRDEATLRVSAKAFEVNVGPAFSIPYAHYSGFVHSDGNALAAYGIAAHGATVYDIRGRRPLHVPLAADLHRALLRLADEVRSRCPSLSAPAHAAYLAAHRAWLAEADRADARLFGPGADR